MCAAPCSQRAPPYPAVGRGCLVAALAAPRGRTMKLGPHELVEMDRCRALRGHTVRRSHDLPPPRSLAIRDRRSAARRATYGPGGLAPGVLPVPASQAD